MKKDVAFRVHDKFTSVKYIRKYIVMKEKISCFGNSFSFWKHLPFLRRPIVISLTAKPTEIWIGYLVSFDPFLLSGNENIWLYEYESIWFGPNFNEIWVLYSKASIILDSFTYSRISTPLQSFVVATVAVVLLLTD